MPVSVRLVGERRCRDTKIAVKYKSLIVAIFSSALLFSFMSI